jgi:hypothetical protein
MVCTPGTHRTVVVGLGSQVQGMISGVISLS